MKPTEETWTFTSYEGPSNGGGFGRIGKRHGASVCIGTVEEEIRAHEAGGPEPHHECLMTALGDSEDQAKDRAYLASAAPVLYRALMACMNRLAEVADIEGDTASSGPYFMGLDATRKARGQQ